MTPCTHCETATATHHTAPDSPHDPCCETCYNARWTACDHCESEVLKSDVHEVCTDHGHRDQPACYEDRCVHCLPSASEPDYDAINDARDDR